MTTARERFGGSRLRALVAVPRSMAELTVEELNGLLRDASVLEQDAHGPKVMALTDGRYFKCFRRKRLANRDVLVPAAVRFHRHALRLRHLGVPTFDVVSVHRLPGRAATAASYRPLPGVTLRRLLATSAANGPVMARVGAFLAELHRLGVYFRSVHPGNIVIDGPRIGLIDVLDMRFRPWSLTRWERIHNWRHFLRCRDDRPYLSPELTDALLAGYLDAAALPPPVSVRMAEQVRRLHARLADPG